MDGSGSKEKKQIMIKEVTEPQARYGQGGRWSPFACRRLPPSSFRLLLFIRGSSSVSFSTKTIKRQKKQIKEEMVNAVLPSVLLSLLKNLQSPFFLSLSSPHIDRSISKDKFMKRERRRSQSKRREPKKPTSEKQIFR